MLRALVVALAAALPLVDLVFAHPQATPPRKVAFLVGIGKYDHKFSDLGTAPVNDVTELAKELAGFEVVTLTGSKADNDPYRATKKNIEARFKELLDGTGGKRPIRDGDTVLVLLCGHGVEEKATDPATGKPDKDAQPFFCPVDARPDDTNTMVPLNSLIRAGEAFGGTNLFLVDACREVPLEMNRTRTGIQGKKVALPDKTAVLFACGSGQLSHQSDKLDKGHGLFTFAVLKTLRGGGRVTWTKLVNGVEEAFESDELKAHITDRRGQQPVEAKGQLGTTEVVAARPAGARPKADVIAPPSNDVAKKSDEGAEYTSKTTGMKFRRIKADTFMMGSPDGEKDRSGEDLHPVTLTKDYYMGVFEVTRGQFKQFADAENYKAEGEPDGKGGFGWDADKKDWRQDPKFTWQTPGFVQTDDHPVVLVSWNDAAAFCKWLSKKDGKAYQLPTEAEWEFACRAGSSKRFSFGDDEEGLAKHGNLADADFRSATGKDWGIKASDRFPFTAPVGSYTKNAFGLADMHGNAAEWCRDYYGPYHKIASKVNPFQDTDQAGERRVVRGGSWLSEVRSCRAADRMFGAPGDRNNYAFGFRVSFVAGE